MQRRAKQWIAGLGVAVAVLVAVGWWAGRPASVRAVAVQRGPIVQTVVVSGQVQAPTQWDVGSEVTATVRSVAVREGQTVRAGQLLVQLDDEEARAAVQQAEAALQEARLRRREQFAVTAPVSEATLQQAEANLRTAEREAERVRALVAQGFFSAQRADEAERAWAQARSAWQAARAQAQANRAGEVAAALLESRLRQAEAALALAQARLARTRVVSPVDGVVLARHVEPGSLAQPGRPLLTLAAQAPLRVEAAVDERHVRLLAPGLPARVAADADPTQPLDAVVDWVAPAADAQRGTVLVRLKLGNPPAWLRPAMTVSVEIVGARRDDARVAPAEAVRDIDSPQPWVLKVQDGRAVRQPVQVGLRGIGQVELTEGVEAGMLLIPQTEKALPGERVRVRQVVAAGR
ncbi:Macrolide export protein MacA [Tepidimonas alkaliphilus]|uniref:Macrolide export protein MacA n=1 Tax=Tepidimonas alkaliphilus TaxID=2588942 RepID=A0A554WB99_9BURK|nr:efflux RND transporter periplasmic adaptor subunit [Tepidimonas alkaliphilus]TSE20849.1 Macrolide export protein MacA [Tepidimonas alkaliphilus]